MGIMIYESSARDGEEKVGHARDRQQRTTEIRCV